MESKTYCDTISLDSRETVALKTYPSVISPAEGVALRELPDASRPSDLSCASRSFCSRTSARRLRKSDRCTRPTVCDLSISSADTVWPVNDRGVEFRLSCSDDSISGGFVRRTSLRRSLDKVLTGRKSLDIRVIGIRATDVFGATARDYKLPLEGFRPIVDSD